MSKTIGQVHLGRRHAGVALVFALLLLMVLVIVGVASMSGISMQERMTSNSLAQARAFEAASAGVANALRFRDRGLAESGRDCGFSANGDWFWPDEGFLPITGDDGEFGGVEGAGLSQRLYCLEYEDLATGFSGRQLFVLSRGEAFSGNQVIATRDIEVRVDRIGVPDGPACNSSPWCFRPTEDLGLKPNCPGPESREFCSCNWGAGTGGDPSTNPFSAANSNFRVVGQEFSDQGVGPAVTLPPNAVLALQCAISQGDTVSSCESNNLNTGGCQRLDNYVGGFVPETDFGLPWSDPDETYKFAMQLLMAADLLVVPSDFGDDRPGLADDNTSLNSDYWEEWRVNLGGGDRVTYEGFQNPQGNFDFGEGIHYIAGDAEFSGTVSGSGILVVEGRMDWSGGNRFDGLIIVLGGEAKIGGGGSGGDEGGSLVVVDLEQKPSSFAWKPDGPDEVKFGDAFSIEVGGGGGAEFSFNCASIWEAYSLIYEEYGFGNTDPDALWEPNCDPNATEPPSGTRTAIVSWRENIGWRAGERFVGAQ